MRRCNPYLDAGALYLWNTPLVLVLLAITAELLSVVVLLRVVRRFLDDQSVRTACIFYLCSAVSIQFVTIDGQDNALVALALAVCIWLISKGRIIEAGVTFAAGLVFVKFLPLIFLPMFVAACPRPARFFAGFHISLSCWLRTFCLARPQTGIRSLLVRKHHKNSGRSSLYCRVTYRSCHSTNASIRPSGRLSFVVLPGCVPAGSSP